MARWCCSHQRRFRNGRLCRRLRQGNRNVLSPFSRTGELVSNTPPSPKCEADTLSGTRRRNGDIYVQRFSVRARGRDTSAGEYPAWRGDGKEIVYLAGTASGRSGGRRAAISSAPPEPLPLGPGPWPRVQDVSHLAIIARRLRVIYVPQPPSNPDSDDAPRQSGSISERPKVDDGRRLARSSASVTDRRGATSSCARRAPATRRCPGSRVAACAREGEKISSIFPPRTM